MILVIRSADEAILKILKKGMTGKRRSVEITRGYPGDGDRKGIYLVNHRLDVRDPGAGGAAEVVREEAYDRFDADGKTFEFRLSKTPACPPISVESPAGARRDEHEQYEVDHLKGVIRFMIPPGRSEKVIVRYRTSKAAGEVLVLKASLGYTLEIHSDDADERDDLTVSLIHAIYRGVPELVRQGVTEVRSVQASSVIDGDVTINRVDFEADATMTIETQALPIESIEIEKTRI